MANKRLNAIITIGGAVSNSLGAAFGAVRRETTQVGQAVQQLVGRQRELNSVIKEQERLGRAGSALKVQYAHEELAVIGKQIEALKKRQALETRISSAQQANLSRRAELRGQIFDMVAIGTAISAPVVAATRFEDAMLGVAKQVQGARDAGGKLTPIYYEMGRAIRELAGEIPMTTTELADMVTAGARMGVARDQLIEFTRTSAMMAEAFELPAGELAEQMGKIAGLYKIPIPEIGRLADTINWLDDNAISKGGDIIDFLTRTGGAAGSVKITDTEMAALGSTLLTLGERTESAGTAVNAMLQKFGAAEKGSKKMQRSLRQIGLSPREVQRGMQTDAAGTIRRVLEGVGNLPEDQRLGVMVELVGLEHSDTLAKLAVNMEGYRRQIALANDEQAKGSMSREFAARLATTGAQAELARNKLNNLAINIGSVLLPSINGGLGIVGSFASKLADLAERFPTVTKVIVGTVVGLGSLRIATLVGAYAFTFLKGGVLSLVAGALRLAPALRLVATGVMLIGRALLLTPIGLIVTGIATAAYLIYKYWGPLKEWFTELWGGIKDTFASVYDWIVGKVATLMELPGRIKDKVAGVFGWGDDEAAPATASAAETEATARAQGQPSRLPDVPPMAQRQAGASITDNSQTTINVTQQPGQDARALAEEIERRMQQRSGIRARSSLIDGVGAQ